MNALSILYIMCAYAYIRVYARVRVRVICAYYIIMYRERPF